MEIQHAVKLVHRATVLLVLIGKAALKVALLFLALREVPAYRSTWQ